MLRRTVYLLVISSSTLYVTGCARKSTVATSQSSRYEEDLSQVRPRFSYKEITVKEPVAPVKEPAKPVEKGSSPLYVNKQLNAALDTLAKQNKLIRYISGYRIQIYSGNIRSEAETAKSYIYQSFPDLMPYVTYTQPSYKVKVGDFMYRSDAEAFLAQIRDQYASAVILPDKVDIKRGLVTRVTDK